MRHLWSNKALCLCFWLIFVIKHKKCKIPLIFIAILQVYDCIYKRGKNEVFRTCSLFCCSYNWINIILQFLFYNTSRSYSDEIGEWFFYVRCVIKKFVMNLHFIFHIASALYQPSINFSHRAFIPLAYIGVSSLHMMKYEKRVCIILYENANAYYANGNTKDTIHFSFLKNMIWIFMLLPNLG